MYIRGSEEILKPGEPAEYIRETGELAEPKKCSFSFIFFFHCLQKLNFLQFQIFR